MGAAASYRRVYENDDSVIAEELLIIKKRLDKLVMDCDNAKTELRTALKDVPEDDIDYNNFKMCKDTIFIAGNSYKTAQLLKHYNDRLVITPRRNVFYGEFEENEHDPEGSDTYHVYKDVLDVKYMM